jgi:DNA-binding MarR family transcriptional regulator
MSNNMTSNNQRTDQDQKEADMRKREERIGFEIRRLDHMLARNIQACVKSAGLDEVTLMHGWIIRFLYANRDRDIFQKDVEQHFSIGRSTVTNIIQLMEKKGFVARQSVEHDARLKKVVLTEKGIQSHETMEALIESLDMSLVEGITDGELEVFYSVIEKLKENLTANGRDSMDVSVLKAPTDGREEEIDDPDFIV